MKIAGLKLSAASFLVLLIQLALVSSIAAKYAWQRARCPRVWTRASMYDPALVMRGRYLSMQLTVDGCQSTLNTGKEAEFYRDQGGVPRGGRFAVAGPQFVEFPATLAVKDNRLIAVRVSRSEETPAGLRVWARQGASCDQMTLREPVNFYIAEHAQSPLPVAGGQELWVEVTVPPKGPPRPIQLALKEADGAWKPLAFQ
jgi:hypothetical protein